jgi:hypothetical protein
VLAHRGTDLDDLGEELVAESTSPASIAGM